MNNSKTEAVDKPNLKLIHTRHSWDGDTALLKIKIKRGNEYISRNVHINFKQLKVKRNGLLEYAIRDCPCPAHSSIAYDFRNAISRIATHPKIRKILSSHPEDLELADLNQLLASVDQLFISKGQKSSAAQAEKVRNVFLKCKARLRNGIVISQTGYTPLLETPPRKPRRDISDREDSTFESSELSLPASAVTGTSLEELDKKGESHYRKRLDKIISRCLEILDEHEKTKQKIEEVVKTALPSSLQARTLKKLKQEGTCDYKVMARRTPEEKLRIALYIIEFHSLHKNAPKNNLILLEGISLLDALGYENSSRKRFGVLLSNYYLSRFVVTACFIILLRYTMWNPDTLVSVTAKDVRVTPHGYEITGLKGKTGQFQTVSITKNPTSHFIEEPAAVRALNLLLWHDKNVSDYGIRHSDSLFVSLRADYSGMHEFNIFLHGRDFKHFTKKWNLPEFTASDIRTQAARHDYLKNGKNLEITQAKLGHASPKTTLLYAGGPVEQALSTANIKRYMDLLAHSVLITTKRRSLPDNLPIEDKFVAKKMLLPPTRFSENTGDYLIDDWLASTGKVNLEIGEEEAKQCIYQKKYFADNWKRLRDSNPNRFLKYEVPRMVTCWALYKLLKNSPLKKQIEEYEKALYA